MSIRYKSQDRAKNCGPIAVHNVFLWAGINKNRKTIEKGCLYGPKIGTWLKNIHSFLSKKTKLKVVKKKSPKLKRLTQHLQSGGIIVLRYLQPHKKWGHIVMISGSVGSSFIVHNYHKGKGTSKVSQKMLKNAIQRSIDSDGDFSPAIALLVSK